MTNDELSAKIEKLHFQVQALGQTIDNDRNPVEALIIEKDWGHTELEMAHDIFEKWEVRLEKGEVFNRIAFEADFKNELRVSYQGLKSIILSFYRNSQWTTVCEAYVDSFDGSPSVEFHSIMRRKR